MKTLKAFYKEEIKKVSADLKNFKPKFRQYQSLSSRGLNESEEYKQLDKELLRVNLYAMRIRARLLNLTYAVIRNKDISKVETNPKNPVDQKELDSFMVKMNDEYQKLTKETASEAV